MKLTPSQRFFLVRRRIEVGEAYPLPRWGFSVYSGPSFGDRGFIDTNPFTRSLDHDLAEVKEIKGPFVRINLLRNPVPYDFWMEGEELSRRDVIESLLLTLLCYVPMLVWNLVRR